MSASSYNDNEGNYGIKVYGTLTEEGYTENEVVGCYDYSGNEAYLYNLQLGTSATPPSP
jgi:hypothetical protein